MRVVRVHGFGIHEMEIGSVWRYKAKGRLVR